MSWLLVSLLVSVETLHGIDTKKKKKDKLVWENPHWSTLCLLHISSTAKVVNMSKICTNKQPKLNLYLMVNIIHFFFFFV